MNTTPQPIPDSVRENFNTLLKAARRNGVALVSALTKDGRQVYLVCAMNRTKNCIIPVPFAEMIDGNPYELYQDPTQ